MDNDLYQRLFQINSQWIECCNNLGLMCLGDDVEKILCPRFKEQDPRGYQEMKKLLGAINVIKNGVK